MILLAVGGWSLGCNGDAPFASADTDSGSSVRAARYGIFRDLVYFPGSDGAAGFFLDLFEATQSDWRVYRAGRESLRETRDFLLRFTPGGVLDGALPVVGLDLDEARDYARWRFGRLPRRAEWDHAARGGGVYRHPWGNSPRVAYANAGELGSGRLSPVGMFESGRQPGRPFDLVGNASEWTETVLYPWRAAAAGDRDAPVDFMRRISVVRRLLTLRPFWPRRWAGTLPLPVPLLVAVDDDLPRFLSGGAPRPIAGRRRDSAFPLVDSLRPGERGSFVGVRVATDPECLLTALAGEVESPPVVGEQLLREFLRRFEGELGDAWHGLAPRLRRPAGDESAQPLVDLLDAELGGGG